MSLKELQHGLIALIVINRSFFGQFEVVLSMRCGVCGLICKITAGSCMFFVVVGWEREGKGVIYVREDLWLEQEAQPDSVV